MKTLPECERRVRLWSKKRWGSRYKAKDPAIATASRILALSLFLSERGEGLEKLEAELTLQHPLGGISLRDAITKLGKPVVSGRRRSKNAKAAELRTAEALGGKLVFLSGAGDEKGDVRVKSLTVNGVPVPARVEVKHTTKTKYSLTRTTWEKLEASTVRGEVPLFVVHFTPPDESEFSRVVMSYSLYLDAYGSEMWINPEGRQPRATLSISRNRKFRRVNFAYRDLAIIDFHSFSRRVKEA